MHQATHHASNHTPCIQPHTMHQATHHASSHTCMSLEDVQHTSYTKLLNDRDDISCIARFRLRSHYLNVELMRNAPRSARLCEYCMKSSNKQKVVEESDELHFMLECPLFTSEREILLNQLKLDPLRMDKLDLMRHTMKPSSLAGWKSWIEYINMCNNKRTSEM